jgi:glycosyltransferase involved in cell wall biosynthesis
MVAFGSTMLNEDGYSVRVAMATRAVVAVQERSCPPPVLLSFEALRSLRRRPQRKAAAARLRSIGAIPLFVPVFPARMPFSYRLNGWWAALVVWVVCRLFSVGIVHAQSHAAASAAARALAWDRRRRLVFDVHGVDVEERQFYGALDADSPEYGVRRRHERESFRRADVIITVSHDLERYVSAILASGGPRSPHPHIEVIPCVLSFSASPQDIEDARGKARTRLRLRGRPCVLYLGGSSGWQLSAETVAAFAFLRRKLPSAFLLILTGDVETFTELCRDAGIPPADFLITSCPHKEVADTACAADAALLLRSDNIVNRVASPTKFAEYLSMGVPVVITDVLADFSGIVRDRDVGAVVPASNAPELVAAAILDLLDAPIDEQARTRTRCVVASQDLLSFESILPAYRRIYRPAAEASR